MTDHDSRSRADDRTLIFACSGASDTGEIADRAARRLQDEGRGRMFCTNGIGGGVNSIVFKARAGRRILAIDGCALDCARRTLQNAGFNGFEHLRLSDMGLEKGRSPVTEERLEQALAAARALLNG